MHVGLFYYLHSLIDVGLLYKKTDGLSDSHMSVQSSVFAEEWPFL